MRKIITFLPWAIALFLGAYILFDKESASELPEPGDNNIISHQILVEKVSSLGKLELVKYNLKDIIEHKVIKQWLPDPKVVLIASGEIVGCIDLSGIDSTKLNISADSIIIKLPAPEICYFKINHQDSKVYHIEYHYFEHAELIDKAYRQAEIQLERSAVDLDILEQTRYHAKVILQPILENVAGRKVHLLFDVNQ